MNFQPPNLAFPQLAAPQLQLITASGIGQIIRRRSKLIIVTVAAITAIGLLACFALTPLYEAEATVVLNSRVEKLENVEDVVSPLPLDQALMGAVVRSEIDVLQSRPLAAQVIDKLNLMADPEFNPDIDPGPSLVASALFWMNEDKQRQIDAGLRTLFAEAGEWLGIARTDDARTQAEAEATTRNHVIDKYLKRLSVTNDALSLTIKISMQSKDPDLAQKIVNTHADLYLAHQTDDKYDETKRVNAWLTKRVDDLKAQVSQADKAVEQYREAHNIITSDKGSTIVSQQLAELNSQLVVARADREQAEAKLKQVRDLLDTGASLDAMPDVLASPTIQQLRQQETTLIASEADMASRYTDNHPALIKVRAQLLDVRGAIMGEVRKIAVSLEKNLDIAASKERSLQHSVDDLTQKVSGLNMASVKLNQLQSEADAARTLLQTFSSRLEETAAGPTITGPEARVVSPANVPTKPIFPRKSLFLGGAFLLGTVIAAGLAGIAEALDHRIYSDERLESVTGIRNLGVVPAFHAPRWRVARRKFDGVQFVPQPAGIAARVPALNMAGNMAGAPGRRDGGASVRPPIPPHRDVPAASRDRLAGAVVKYPMSSYAEAIRVTRTALRHSPSGNPPKIVLITSSVPGEGKTSLAISLARSSAMSGLRTLLIDADIRRPRIGAIFGAKSPGTSLIDYLEDTADYGAIVHRDRETMMDYVTGRLGVANSLDLLSSEKFAELLRHAQSQYDAIYLDSSPVLAVADPTVLARMADGVAFVIRWGETTEQVALSAMKLLQSSGADIAGTVLSCVNVQKLASYRAGGTGYYFGRYPSYYST